MRKRFTLPLTVTLTALMLTGCAAAEEEPEAWVYTNKVYSESSEQSDIRFTVAGGTDENPTGMDFENIQQMTRPGTTEPWKIYDEYKVEEITKEALEVYLDLRTDPRIYEAEEPVDFFYELLTKDYPGYRSGEFFWQLSADWTLNSVRSADISMIPLPNFDKQHEAFSVVDTSKPQEISFSEPVVYGYVTEEGGISMLHAEFRETVKFHMVDGETREYGSMVGVTYTGDTFTEHHTDSETAIYNIVFLEDRDPGDEEYDHWEASRGYSLSMK